MAPGFLPRVALSHILLYFTKLFFICMMMEEVGLSGVLCISTKNGILNSRLRKLVTCGGVCRNPARPRGDKLQ